MKLLVASMCFATILTGCSAVAEPGHDEYHPAAQAQGGMPMGKGPMGKGMGGGRMGRMGDAGGMMPMMGMPMPGMMGGGMPMMGMMSGHIEGSLAFIKAELKINEAQTAAWNAFADAVRSNSGAMKEMHEGMMPKSPRAVDLPERLDLQEKMMTAHLGALKKTKGALTALYAVLSADQKKTANELFAMPMGMM